MDHINEPVLTSPSIKRPHVWFPGPLPADYLLTEKTIFYCAKSLNSGKTNGEIHLF